MINFLILLIMLILLIGISIQINDGDPFAPAPLLCEMYFISIFFAFLASKRWGFELNINTVMVIITALISFIVGMFMGKNISIRLKIRKKNWEVNINKKETSIVVDKHVMFFINVYCIVGLIYRFKQVFMRAKGINASVNLSNFMVIIRGIVGSESGGISDNIWSVLLIYSINGLGYIFTFIILYNLICCKDKKGIKHNIVPCISLFGMGVLSSGRTFAISWIAVILVLGFLLYCSCNELKSISWTKTIKFISYALVGILLFFIVFQFLGMLTGKTQRVGAFEMISGYAGGSIPALDSFLQIYLGNMNNTNHLWGQETFYGIYKMFTRFGLDIDLPLHLPFISFGDGYSINVYTAIRTYVYDFGVVGLCILEILLGFILTLIYIRIKRSERNLDKIIFCNIYSGFVLQGIEEVFLRALFTVDQILEIGFIIIFYYLLVHKRIRIKIR